MRTRLFPTLLGTGIGLAVVAVPAHATNDIEATAQLCAARHGQNGVPSDPKTVPIIWGQERSYLFKQMRNYRNGERDNSIMSPIAKSLAEEDLRKIASYFAAKSWPARSATEYIEHFHAERNHQGKGNVLLFPRGTNIRCDGPVQSRERLGGLLRYYHQEAA
jgi:cytochrome c553